MKIILLSILLALIPMLEQCSAPFLNLFIPSEIEEEPVVEEIDMAKYDHGVEVYLSSYCGICHALGAAETTGTFGPPHDQMGLVAEERYLLSTYGGNATSAEEYIRESLLDPTVFMTPGYEATSHPMPIFTHLEENDLDDLIYMLLHQRNS